MQALVAALVILVPPAPGVVKCGGMPNTFPGFEGTTPIVVVDDRVLGPHEDLESLRGLPIERLEVTCWDPETGAIGVRGIHLVRIVTRDAHRDLETPALAAVAHQGRVVDETGLAAQDVEALDLGDLGDVEAVLEADGPRWRLVLEARFERCEVTEATSAGDVGYHGDRAACRFRDEEQSAALARAHAGAPQRS